VRILPIGLNTEAHGLLRVYASPEDTDLFEIGEPVDPMRTTQKYVRPKVTEDDLEPLNLPRDVVEEIVRMVDVRRGTPQQMAINLGNLHDIDAMLKAYEGGDKLVRLTVRDRLIDFAREGGKKPSLPMSMDEFETGIEDLGKIRQVEQSIRGRLMRIAKTNSVLVKVAFPEDQQEDPMDTLEGRLARVKPGETYVQADEGDLEGGWYKKGARSAVEDHAMNLWRAEGVGSHERYEYTIYAWDHNEVKSKFLVVIDSTPKVEVFGKQQGF
jgi:hypothetical protein